MFVLDRFKSIVSFQRLKKPLVKPAGANIIIHHTHKHNNKESEK